MIFQRSILREKITLTAVIFFTLFTILTVFFLVRSLNDVNQGKISVDVLLQYLLVVSLGYFPLIMVATVMIALISTIARIYKDSEMVVWQTSGASHWAIFRPVWMLVLPMFGFLLFMNAVMLPWTNQKMSAFPLRGPSTIRRFSRRSRLRKNASNRLSVRIESHMRHRRLTLQNQSS